MTVPQHFLNFLPSRVLEQADNLLGLVCRLPRGPPPAAYDSLIWPLLPHDCQLPSDAASERASSFIESQLFRRERISLFSDPDRKNIWNRSCFL